MHPTGSWPCCDREPQDMNKIFPRFYSVHQGGTSKDVASEKNAATVMEIAARGSSYFVEFDALGCKTIFSERWSNPSGVLL